MAYQRKMAGGQSMRLFYSPDRPKTDSTLTLNANVMGADGEPLHMGNVQCKQMISPSGKSQVIKLLPAQAEDSWGLIRSSLHPTRLASIRPNSQRKRVVKPSKPRSKSRVPNWNALASRPIAKRCPRSLQSVAAKLSCSVRIVLLYSRRLAAN